MIHMSAPTPATDSGLVRGLVPNAPHASSTGVVLLNMGGPDRIESIQPFLNNIFSDREIIRLPGGRVGQAVLGRMIVRKRLRDVQENYRLIGGSSPQLRWTRLQAEGLQRELNERLQESPIVGVAMRYWHPRADETLRAMRKAGVQRVVALTLYPHYTRATTGSSIADLIRANDAMDAAMDVSFIDRWPEHPRYLDLWAARLRQTLDGLEPSVRERAQIVVSAHGLPKRFIDRGDPYVEHIRATMEGVLSRLDSPPPAHLGFQSRTGPVQWIGPGTEDVIGELAAAGHDALVVWPIAFVSDHIETTYEVDMLFREHAESLGVTEYHFVPSFNDDPRFSPVLADLVEPCLRPVERVGIRS